MYHEKLFIFNFICFSIPGGKCRTNNDCTTDKMCLNGMCVDPCSIKEHNPCEHQKCQCINHQPVCMTGNVCHPYILINLY